MTNDTFRAIAYDKPGDASVLQRVELPRPEIGPRDLWVEVRAIGMNPADPKIRQNLALQGEGLQVLGFDAAGVVRGAGSDVRHFTVGDEVYYAGAVNRWGSNATHQCVDERIVGKKPRTLSFAEAAALPLTAITAWELLFDRLGFDANTKSDLLLLGAAGGVGSMLIQIAKTRTQCRVVATASRPETRAWVTELGADVVINHRNDLREEAAQAGVGNFGAAIAMHGTDQHLAALADLIAPQGKLGLVDDPQQFDIAALKLKSISLHWEFMFTKSLFGTDDIESQHDLLTAIANDVDAKRIRGTLRQNLGPMTLEGLRKAHDEIMTTTAVGKMVFDGVDLG